MSEYLLTYLWVGMECVAAVLLFDAFSQRKKRQIAHWIFVACFAFLDATLLNLMSPNMANFGKIVIAVAVYYFFHRLLYIGRRVFSLYIAVIFYATICCIDNIWFTFWVLILGIPMKTNESLLHKGMRTIVQSALRREANEPCHVCWVYQPHRPEKPLPQPQDKK